MALTFQEVLDEVRMNLDDELNTGFSDVALKSLVNTAHRWTANYAASHDYYYRASTESISVSSGTNEYTLTSVDIRHPFMVEIIRTNTRQEGSIISYRDRNRTKLNWPSPIVYFLPFGQGQLKLHFALPNEPSSSYNLLVSYAPDIQPLTQPTDRMWHVDPDLITLVILRATIMGYGGEKNADQYWLSQYQSAMETALELFDKYKANVPQYVNQEIHDEDGIDWTI